MLASRAATFSRNTSVPVNHPCLAGHFPGDPVVPGVLLLDMVGALLQQWKPGSRIAGIVQAKFHQLLRPEQLITVTLWEPKPGNVAFECLRGPEKIASGVISIEMPA
jgi:3-hydroxyacyl-[acyl-carrier-protein] dehydratase